MSHKKEIMIEIEVQGVHKEGSIILRNTDQIDMINIEITKIIIEITTETIEVEMM